MRDTDTLAALATDDELDAIRQRRTDRILAAQAEIKAAYDEYDAEIDKVGGHLVDAAA